jgi:hypothetical protein
VRGKAGREEAAVQDAPVTTQCKPFHTRRGWPNQLTTLNETLNDDSDGE